MCTVTHSHHAPSLSPSHPHSLGGDLNSHLHRLGEAVSHVLVNGLNALDVNICYHLHQKQEWGKKTNQTLYFSKAKN